MINLLSVFIGGGIGAVLRYGICSRINGPLGVFLVNVFGAFLIGVAFHFFANRIDLRPEIKSFIITGLLGGFTTFSTYILDFNTLINNRQWEEASFYLVGSVVLGFVFLLIGLRVSKVFF